MRRHPRRMLRIAAALIAISAASLNAQAPATDDRVAGWRSDLRYYLAELGKRHYVLRNRPLPPRIVAAAARLDSAIPRMSDERVLLEFERLASYAGDAHTYILPFGAQRVPAFVVPLRFHLFADGLFVVDATNGYEKWIGAKVVRLGGVPAATAIARLDSMASRDNAITIRWTGPFLLRFRGALDAIGAGPIGDSVAVTLKPGKSGAQTVRVPFVPVPRMRGVPKLLASRVPGAPPAPRWLRDVEQPFAMETTARDKDVLLVQFNQVMDAPNESLAQFAERLDRELTSKKPRAVIVDVRHNNGGRGDLIGPWVDALKKYEQSDPPGVIYVLTGPNTFSAAQIFISKLDRETSAIFAGEPSSSRPNFVGEENEVVLPWSGAIGSISDRYHENIPGDKRQWIAPGISVPLTSTAYFAGRDPVMAAVLAHINRNR